MYEIKFKKFKKKLNLRSLIYKVWHKDSLISDPIFPFAQKKPNHYPQLFHLT